MKKICFYFYYMSGKVTGHNSPNQQTPSEIEFERQLQENSYKVLAYICFKYYITSCKNCGNMQSFHLSFSPFHNFISPYSKVVYYLENSFVQTGVVNDPLGKTTVWPAVKNLFLLDWFSKRDGWTENMCEYSDH